MLSLISCADVPQSDAAGNKPAHHASSGFRNPYVEDKKRDVWAYLRMRLTERGTFPAYPGREHKIPTATADLPLIQGAVGSPQVTWIGHATVLIQHAGINVLTDPIFSQRASPLGFAGPKRYTQPALTIEQLPRIHYVVISHNHYDHLDRDTVQHLADQTQWLVPLGHRDWFEATGVESANIHEFDWWDTSDFADGRFTATPSQHWSARGLWDRNRALWASWIIEIHDLKVWFAGDTGYNAHQFKEIGQRAGPFDLGIIPIGGYAPRYFMGDMHVNPQEAVKVHKDIKAKRSLGVHWGTFLLTGEPIDEPPQKLREALRDQNLTEQDFFTLGIGETRRFPRRRRHALSSLDGVAINALFCRGNEDILEALRAS